MEVVVLAGLHARGEAGPERRVALPLGHVLDDVRELRLELDRVGREAVGACEAQQRLLVLLVAALCSRGLSIASRSGSCGRHTSTVARAYHTVALEGKLHAASRK